MSKKKLAALTLLAATALAVLIIFHLLRLAQDDDRLLTVGLGLILGGAVGNLIDRIKTAKGLAS